MRKLFLAVLLTVSATPCYAQQLASVQVTAYLQIPELLSMRVGETTSVTSANTQRVTVYVSANRKWQLTIAPTCAQACPTLRWRVVNGGSGVTADGSRVVGSRANDLPVVIEYRWDAGGTPPDPADLRYLLSAG